MSIQAPSPSHETARNTIDAKKAAPFREPPKSCAKRLLLPVTIAATVAVIAITIAIAASVPATAIVVTHKAYLVSLYAANIDGAKVANR